MKENLLKVVDSNSETPEQLQSLPLLFTSSIPFTISTADWEHQLVHKLATRKLAVIEPRLLRTPNEVSDRVESINHQRENITIDVLHKY